MNAIAAGSGLGYMSVLAAEAPIQNRAAMWMSYWRWRTGAFSSYAANDMFFSPKRRQAPVIKLKKQPFSIVIRIAADPSDLK